MKTILLLFIFSSALFAQTIPDLMKKQELAWNTGDIDSFMKYYWKSDSLKFIGSSGITYGWQKTLDNYKKKYPDAKALEADLGNLLLKLGFTNEKSAFLASRIAVDPALVIHPCSRDACS